MRDIFSYPPETKFTGKEILDWANLQIENETLHANQGVCILNRFSGIDHNRLYQIKHPINNPNDIGCLIDCGYE